MKPEAALQKVFDILHNELELRKKLKEYALVAHHFEHAAIYREEESLLERLTERIVQAIPVNVILKHQQEEGSGETDATPNR